MVVSAIVEFVAGDSARLALGIALLGVLLYYRKALIVGDVLSTWGGRLAFGLGLIGAGLILGVIPGIDIARAGDLAGQVISVGGDLLAEVREVVGA